MEKSLKVEEIRKDKGKILEGPLIIINCPNRSLPNLGGFKGSDIVCKCSEIYVDKNDIPEFPFRAVTRKELYSVIDSLVFQGREASAVLNCC